jgi:hypothetical protein
VVSGTAMLRDVVIQDVRRGVLVNAQGRATIDETSMHQWQGSRGAGCRRPGPGST